MRSNILFSLLTGIFTSILSFHWSQFYWLDLNPPLCSARQLLLGLEPYSGCATNYGGLPAAQYPMTTILAFLPVAWLPGSLAAALIWGGINSLLFFAIIRTGKPWRLLVFASGPYAMAFLYHQPSPLIAAVMLLPFLLPVALVKPQTGIPVILTHLTPLRVIGCLAFLALTFIVYPRWPWTWWESARNYDGVIPLFNPSCYLG
jgi:hypothetical protein